MSGRRFLLLVIAAAIASTTARVPAQQPVFRTGALSVTVPVVVKRGNRVVANLTAGDFRLTDNGVEQKIEAVAMQSVPVDVTLFLDTSGSTDGKFEEMKSDVQAIVKLLRPGDRFRLLTIGDSVEVQLPWVPAGTTVSLSFNAVGGISLIHDALAMGLLHRSGGDRRHLVVGMTDGEDCGSVVSSAQLQQIASRSEAVLHIFHQSGAGVSVYRTRACTPMGRFDGPGIIAEAARSTGGTLVRESAYSFGRSPILGAFKTIFEEFRQSYVLRYSPAGVPRGGWHAIAVEVPSQRGVTVRARQGYYD